MEKNIKIELKQEIVEQLDAYSQLLQKTPSDMVNEALEGYFSKAQEQLDAKTLDLDNGMSNLSYDEFWDDVEI